MLHARARVCSLLEREHAGDSWRRCRCRARSRATSSTEVEQVVVDAKSRSGGVTDVDGRCVRCASRSSSSCASPASTFSSARWPMAPMSALRKLGSVARNRSTAASVRAAHGRRSAPIASWPVLDVPRFTTALVLERAADGRRASAAAPEVAVLLLARQGGEPVARAPRRRSRRARGTARRGRAAASTGSSASMSTLRCRQA